MQNENSFILDFLSQTLCLVKCLFWSYHPLDQSDCRILLSVIFLEKLRDQVDFWFTDNNQSF